jgi:hypothetical protein
MRILGGFGAGLALLVAAVAPGLRPSVGAAVPSFINNLEIAGGRHRRLARESAASGSEHEPPQLRFGPVLRPVQRDLLRPPPTGDRAAGWSTTTPASSSSR